MKSKTDLNETADPAVGSMRLLARVAFEFILGQEEKRIRDEIHRLRVAQLMREGPLRLSESEGAFLCKCTPPLLYSMGKATMTPRGVLRVFRLALARTAQPLEHLCFHLNRTLYIAEILRHRLARQLRLFFGVSCANH